VSIVWIVSRVRQNEADRKAEIPLIAIAGYAIALGIMSVTRGERNRI